MLPGIHSGSQAWAQLAPHPGLRSPGTLFSPRPGASCLPAGEGLLGSGPARTSPLVISLFPLLLRAHLACCCLQHPGLP